MTDNWVIRTVHLKFRLGEFIVFAVPFRLKVSTLDFAELKARGIQPDPPQNTTDKDLDGLLIQSLPVSASLPSIQFNRSIIRYIPNRYQRFFIDLDMTLEDYLQKFSTKSRSTLKRKVNKFAKFSGGGIDWREYVRPQEVKDFYRFAREISEKTYQEKLFDAGLPKSERFQRQMLEFAEQNRVRAYLLFHNEKAIAYLYLPVSSMSLIYQHLGYDQEYAKWSPGTVLQWLVIEKLFEDRQFELFDFTAGEGTHKEFFATGSEVCADIYFVERSFKNSVIIISHCALDRFSQSVARIADQLGVKAKIKKFFRSL